MVLTTKRNGILILTWPGKSGRSQFFRPSSSGCRNWEVPNCKIFWESFQKSRYEFGYNVKWTEPNHGVDNPLFIWSLPVYQLTHNGGRSWSIMVSLAMFLIQTCTFRWIMSLSVLLQSVNGLRGTGDRLAKISFRGKFKIIHNLWLISNESYNMSHMLWVMFTLFIQNISLLLLFCTLANIHHLIIDQP